MSRISSAFERLQAEGRTGFIAYITAGDPSLARTRDILLALARAGADVIEVGVPFSDPLADGPVIQRATERALAAGATLIGVNQRDLTTFAVDTDRAVRVAAAIPPGVVRVAESGITGPADVARLADAGYHAVLVGESLVTSADPAAAVRSLRSAAACS